MITMTSGKIGTSSTAKHAKYIIAGATETEGNIAIEGYNIEKDISNLSKKEIVINIINDCRSETKRKNGITDRRFLFSPISEITKNISVEQILALCQNFLAENMPTWKGYLVCHQKEDNQKHIHCIFSCNDISGNRISLKQSEYMKIYQNYEKMLTNYFPKEMKEYNEKIEEKRKNLSQVEKQQHEETGLLPENTSIRKSFEKNGKIKHAVKKKEYEEKGTYSLTETQSIIRAYTAEKKIIPHEIEEKINKTFEETEKSKYAVSKRGKQFLAKVKNDFKIYKNTVFFEKNLKEKKEELKETRREIQSEKMTLNYQKNEIEKFSEYFSEYTEKKDIKIRDKLLKNKLFEPLLRIFFEIEFLKEKIENIFEKLEYNKKNIKKQEELKNEYEKFIFENEGYFETRNEVNEI